MGFGARLYNGATAVNDMMAVYRQLENQKVLEQHLKKKYADAVAEVKRLERELNKLYEDNNNG